jgi:hypothetical protein
LRPRRSSFHVSVDRKQSRIIIRYIAALLRVPLLSRLIERETAESFDLSTGVTIEVHVASFRSTRGYAIAAVLCDELAFWETSEESAEPDTEVISALRPGMAQFPDAMLLCASSPYAKRGALYDAHRRHFGNDGDPVLVWQSATRTMNPTIAQAVVDEAMERDPASASAEFLAQFRSDLEAFVSVEAVRACVAAGIFESPPARGVAHVAFIDPAGGSGADSMTLCIGHYQASKQTVVIDCLPPRPSSPIAV